MYNMNAHTHDFTCFTAGPVLAGVLCMHAHRQPWYANYFDKVLSEGKIGDLREIS
jgi:hypothetical protein